MAPSPQESECTQPMKTWTGCWFEDFSVGDELVTAGRTMTDGELAQFVGISGNAHPLHVDENYAQSLGFAGRLVHGMLTLSVGMGLMERSGVTKETILAHLGLERVRFITPVFVGDTIRVKMKVVELKPTSDGSRGAVVMQADILNQHDVVVVESVQSFMVGSSKKHH